MTLDVLDPGLLSTIQDGGRPDWTDLGVPDGGACDRWSLAVANRLLDQPLDAPAIEATLIGPTLAVLETTVIALAGADLGGIERDTGRRLVPGRTYRVEAGSVLAFPGPPSGGARMYLAVPGGIDVPRVLGSGSTLLMAGFGGIEGRALVAGDRLEGVTAGPGPGLAGRLWPGPATAAGTADGVLRVVRGPHAGRLGPDALAALVRTPWTVGAATDRMAARLDGPPLPITAGTSVLSHGVTAGTVQVPPDGRPIVLLAEHQTTGGYPVVAVVVSADLGAAGQLRPGATIRVAEVSAADARAALLAQRTVWEAASRGLDEAAGWDELWRSADG